MRNIPVELVTRYEEAAWWTRQTVTSGKVQKRLVRDGLGKTLR
jgi:hypothetical protein